MIENKSIEKSHSRIFFPIRKVNQKALVINSHESLIASLCKIGHYIIIEDIDLDYQNLIEYLNLFEAKGLIIHDLKSTLGLSVSNLFCISEEY